MSLSRKHFEAIAREYQDSDGCYTLLRSEMDELSNPSQILSIVSVITSAKITPTLIEINLLKHVVFLMAYILTKTE
jgi:hypothetical protein